MSKKIDYNKIIDKAMRSIVRRCLEIVDEQDGKLPGNHHFYITFDLDHEGVKISDTLRQKHGHQMTIVLQHQFWDLKVERRYFEITLSFGGIRENMTIPYDALISFADPSARFGLQFDGFEEEEEALGNEEEFEVEFIVDENIENEISKENSDSKKTKGKSKSKAKKGKKEESSKVISLDSFRKK